MPVGTERHSVEDTRCLDLVLVRVGVHSDVYLYEKTAQLTATSGPHTTDVVDLDKETT